MKMASRKKAMPSIVNGSPMTSPNLPMNSGQRTPISNERTVPNTAPTAKRTAVALAHCRASRT